TLAYYMTILSVLRPSNLVLRSFPLLVGLATVIVGGLLGRRAFGPRIGLLAAVILSVLPACLAYSRFAWESCQIPLFGVIALFLAGTGRARALITISPIGFLIHPTNIMLAPLLSCLALADKTESRGSGPVRLARFDRAFLGLLISAAAGGLVVY